MADRTMRIEQPDALFHYTSENGLRGILKTKKIKFSNFKYSNDVKERHDYKVYKNKVKSDIRYFSFCKFPSTEKTCIETQKGATVAPPYKEKDYKSLKSVMWGNYATEKGKMTGACIEFDLDNIKKLCENCEIKHTDLEYLNRAEYYKKKDIDVIERMKLKLDEWSYENEYRLIVSSNTITENDDFGICFSDECIKCIYLGQDFPNKEALIKEYFNIDFRIIISGRDGFLLSMTSEQYEKLLKTTSRKS